MQPDPDAPCRVDPDLATPSHACSTKRLSGVVNQTLPMGMVYRWMRFAVARLGVAYCGHAAVIALCPLLG
jgi:hypothetical protein